MTGQVMENGNGFLTGRLNETAGIHDEHIRQFCPIHYTETGRIKNLAHRF
jgi:hypothetical protein